MSEEVERKSTSTVTPGDRRRGFAMALVTVVCWASAFVAIRVAVRSFAPEEVAWLRFFSAALVLGVIALVTRMSLPRVRDLPALAALGLVGHALYNLALAWGQTRVPAASASFIISSAPIWMLVMSAGLRQERLAGARVVAMLVSLGGVALIAVGRAGSLVLDAPALVVVAASVMQAIYSMGASAASSLFPSPGQHLHRARGAALAIPVRARRDPAPVRRPLVGRPRRAVPRRGSDCGRILDLGRCDEESATELRRGLLVPRARGRSRPRLGGPRRAPFEPGHHRRDARGGGGDRRPVAA
jgi:hypothetical protein